MLFLATLTVSILLWNKIEQMVYPFDHLFFKGLIMLALLGTFGAFIHTLITYFMNGG